MAANSLCLLEAAVILVSCGLQHHITSLLVYFHCFVNANCAHLMGHFEGHGRHLYQIYNVVLCALERLGTCKRTCILFLYTTQLFALLGGLLYGGAAMCCNSGIPEIALLNVVVLQPYQEAVDDDGKRRV